MTNSAPYRGPYLVVFFDQSPSLVPVPIAKEMRLEANQKIDLSQAQEIIEKKQALNLTVDPQRWPRAMKGGNQ